MPGRDRDPDPATPNTPVLGLLETFLHDLPDRLADALRRLGQMGQPPGQQPQQPGQPPASRGGQPSPAAGQPPPATNPFLLGPKPPDPFDALGPLARLAGASGLPFGGAAAGELGRLQTLVSSARQLADLFGRLQGGGRLSAPKPPSRKAISAAARLASGRAPAPRFEGRRTGLPSGPDRVPRLQSPPPGAAYPFPPQPPPVSQRRHARLDLEPPPPALPPLRPGAPAAFPGTPPTTSQRRSARIDLSPPPPETEGLFGGGGVAAAGVGGGPVAALAEVVEELKESVDMMTKAGGGGRRGADQRPFQEPVEGWPRRAADGGDAQPRRGADQRPFVEPKDHDEGGAIAFARTLGTVLKTVADLA